MTGQNDRTAGLEGQIAESARRLAPSGWRRIDLHCMATVAVNDIALVVLTAEGNTAVAKNVPPELTDLLMELRRAHYVPEQGTWFSMLLIIGPGTVQRLYNHDFDPGWDPPIPVDCWRRDQIVMPRDGAYVPGWLRDRLAGREPAEEPAADAGPLNPVEQMELLSDRVNILIADQAPALWQKVFGHYQAAGGHVEFPPMMVHKADGTMAVWTPPAATAGLLDRLRAGTHAFQGSTWSRIDFEVLFEGGEVRCRASFTHDDEPAWNSEPAAEDVRRELERFPRGKVPEWMSRLLAGDADGSGPDGGPGKAPPVTRAEVLHDALLPAGDDEMTDAPVTVVTDRDVPHRAQDDSGDSEPWLGRLQERLKALGVDSAEYRIRGTAEGAWCLAEEGGRWSVFRSRDGRRRKEATFDDTEKAAAYMLGSLLLVQNGTAAAPRNGSAVLESGAAAAAQNGQAVARQNGQVAAPQAVRPAKPDGAAGPIEPLRGEPPLSLLRERRVVELPAGTMVDRHGDPGGNMTYVVRTPFEQRSLPSDWQRRPYYVYRLQRPLEALTGTAVPWFEQPGGGTAYFFRRSVADLLADGSLTEVPNV